MGKPLHIPAGAMWLGAGGLIPFVTLGGSAPFLTGASKDWAIFAVSAYGAAILSFLGGVQWGLVIGTRPHDASHGVPSAGLVLSVLPSLVGWVALLLPAPARLVLLAAGFAGVLCIDVAAARAGKAPAWYPQLRWPLWCIVIASLAVGCFA